MRATAWILKHILSARETRPPIWPSVLWCSSSHIIMAIYEESWHNKIVVAKFRISLHWSAIAAILNEITQNLAYVILIRLQPSSYSDVILNAMASHITSLKIFYSINAPRHWPLCGEFTGDRWIPRTKSHWRGICFHLMTSSWKYESTKNK